MGCRRSSERTGCTEKPNGRVTRSGKGRTLSFAWLPAILFALMLMPHVHAAAEEAAPQACQALVPDPTIIVSVQPEVIPHFRYEPASVIGRSMTGQEGQLYLGLTRAIIGLSVAIRPHRHPYGDRLCLSPGEIEVNLFFNPLEVTIATDIVGNECVENYVMRHEMQHVQFYLEAMEKTANALRADLKKAFPPTFRRIGIASDQTYRKQEISVGIAGRAQELYKRFNIRHRELDDRAELERSYQACGGAILRLTSTRR